jgi:hypothetical protein
LAAVFVYAKFARPCQVLRMSSFEAAANYGSCQILKKLQLHSATSRPWGYGQNLKIFKIYDIIKG